jgi:hypothetical protein
MKRRLIATFFTALSLVSIPLSGPAADESAVSDYLSGENHAARLADPQPILLAQADAETAADTGGSEASGADAPLSPECAAFAKDKDADLGEVMKAGCEPTLAQMSALMDNPLGNVAMWFNQIDQFFLENDATGRGGNQTNYMGILQFPKGVSENWNLINRVVYNVVSSPLDQDKIDAAGGLPSALNCSPPAGGGAPSCDLPIDAFGGRTTGFGDMYYVGLFAPKKGKKLANGATALWGAGFDLLLPTASEDILGTGKWAAGPSALGVYMGPTFKGGALVQQYWSFAGSDNNADVNLTNLQYLYYWSLSDTMSIGAAPNIIINWEESGTSRFTIPVGFGINKTVSFGKLPVRFGFEAHYSVWRPNNIPATEWNLRFYAIPAVPSALFGWMQ